VALFIFISGVDPYIASYNIGQLHLEVSNFQEIDQQEIKIRPEN